MPDEQDPIELPIAGGGDDGVTQVPTDVGHTSDEHCGDIDQDCTEMLLESLARTHEGLQAETLANEETAGNIVRLSAARKFNREDPIEAAAAEKILKKP